MSFLKMVGTLLLFVTGIAAFVGIGYIFPNKMKENMSKYYGNPLISTWWAVAQAVAFVAFTCELDSTEKSFWILLFVMLAIFAAAIGNCILKAKKCGAEKRDIILSCLAQVCHAFGIAITIVLVLFLLFGRNKKKKHR